MCGQGWRRRAVDREDGALWLTEAGRTAAASIIRSHRLWERYLVDEAGLRPDHVHDTAMRLEHLRAGDRRPLAPEDGAARLDPHDRAIPGPGDE